MNFKKRLTNFMELTRAYSLPVTIAPLMIVYSYAQFYENFSLLNMLILTVALCMVHLGANLFDDFIDVKLKLRECHNLGKVHFSSFFNKARLIKDETYSFCEIKKILCVLFGISSIIGIYFAMTSSPCVLIFMALGGILCLIYPISSKYYLSETIIGIIYGPLIILGGFLALIGEINTGLIYPSIAMFFAIIVLLHTHSIMDWEFDRIEGKNTLAILSKSKTNAIEVLRTIIALSYFTIYIGIETLNINPKTLYVFLTLPIAVRLIESLKDYINIKDVEFYPRWYYGFFENWEEIKKNNIAFFMFRFYLARNYVFFFALFLAIGANA